MQRGTFTRAGLLHRTSLAHSFFIASKFNNVPLSTVTKSHHTNRAKLMHSHVIHWSSFITIIDESLWTVLSGQKTWKHLESRNALHVGTMIKAQFKCKFCQWVQKKEFQFYQSTRKTRARELICCSSKITSCNQWSKFIKKKNWSKCRWNLIIWQDL